MKPATDAAHLAYLDALDKRPAHRRWSDPYAERERRSRRRRRVASAASPPAFTESAAGAPSAPLLGAERPQ